MVSCEVRLSAVGLSEFRKLQVAPLIRVAYSKRANRTSLRGHYTLWTLLDIFSDLCPTIYIAVTISTPAPLRLVAAQ